LSPGVRWVLNDRLMSDTLVTVIALRDPIGRADQGMP